MPDQPTFHKIFAGIATRAEMFELFQVPVRSPEDHLTGGHYAGRWFEIRQAEYEEMLNLMPPLFQRSGLFAMCELMAGNVASVFFQILIQDRDRWFHGYCDLSDRHAPEAMRAAIRLWETSDTSGISREGALP